MNDDDDTLILILPPNLHGLDGKPEPLEVLVRFVGPDGIPGDWTQVRMAAVDNRERWGDDG